MNKLQEIAQQLRSAGASLPAPENKGTPESALINGLSIALLLVENAIKEELENPKSEVLFVWDVYNAESKWLQTVTSPIGWDAHQVQEFLVSKGYNKLIHVTLRHSSVLGKPPQQDQFNPDWLSYRQGKEDAKQAPLSNEHIINEGWHECRNKLKDTIFHSEIFMMGVEWAEKQHGIGSIK